MNGDAATQDREQRLAEVLEQYLAEIQAGTAASKSELLKNHPDLADDLAACLASLDYVRGAKVGPGSTSDVDPIPSQPTARTLGDYRILNEIGRGGMGVVYEARQISLNRRVALKVLPLAGVLDQRRRQRFTNEAQAAALLHHQNIVPVYQVGCERGVHYYAMQFVEGQTLASLISDLRQIEKGDADAAFEWLERVMAHDKLRALSIVRNAAFASLRSDPRWDDVLRRLQRHPDQLANVRFEPKIPN